MNGLNKGSQSVDVAFPKHNAAACRRGDDVEENPQAQVGGFN